MWPHRSGSLACLGFVWLLVPGTVWAQALQQLQQTCQQNGANCNVNVPDVPLPTPVPTDSTANQQGQPPKRMVVKPPVPVQPTLGQQMAVGMASGLLEDLFSGLLGDSEPAGPSPEEIAAQERQRVAEFQARAALVSQQRFTRDSQQTSNMEDMAAQMSGGFDRPVDVSSGGSDPVRLQGTTPSLFSAPSNPLVAPPPPNPAAQRLAKLAAENADVRALTKRLSDLSSELDLAKKEADLIGRKSQRRTEEYEAMEQTVARGVSDAWDRGLSLAFDGLFTANAKAVATLSEVQANGRAWRELKSMVEEVQQGAEFVKDSSEKVDQFSEDVNFATRQRDFKEDVTWLAERLGGPYADLGKSILVSAKTVREDLAILHRQGELNGFERQYQTDLERVKDHMDPLIGDVAKVRHELSLRTGIPESEIALPAPAHPAGSFGTEPPPVPAE